MRDYLPNRLEKSEMTEFHIWENVCLMFGGVLLGSGIANGNWISVAVEFGLLNVGLSL